MLSAVLSRSIRPPPRPTLFPYTTLFRSRSGSNVRLTCARQQHRWRCRGRWRTAAAGGGAEWPRQQPRSEEHTSELQSLRHLVCRLLLEKKKETDYLQCSTAAHVDGHAAG